MVRERIFFFYFRSLYLGAVLIKTINPLALVGYEMIIANEARIISYPTRASGIIFYQKALIRPSGTQKETECYTGGMQDYLTSRQYLVTARLLNSCISLLTLNLVSL